MYRIEYQPDPQLHIEVLAVFVARIPYRTPSEGQSDNNPQEIWSTTAAPLPLEVRPPKLIFQHLTAHFIHTLLSPTRLLRTESGLRVT